MENKYNEYKNIRYKRTYRTIGKMSWWRIVFGVILIVFVVFLSGLPSQMLAGRGQFRAAQKAMISPEWMENYKPATKAFIEAGVLYQDGDIKAAIEAFDKIEDFEAADVMISRAYNKLALLKYESQEYDACYDCITCVDYSFLLKEEAEEYIHLCENLIGYYEQSDSSDALSRIDVLNNFISDNTEK